MWREEYYEAFRTIPSIVADTHYGWKEEELMNIHDIDNDHSRGWASGYGCGCADQARKDRIETFAGIRRAVQLARIYDHYVEYWTKLDKVEDADIARGRAEAVRNAIRAAIHQPAQ